MTDTPLYCATDGCHTQLGSRREDGTFVSKHRGRHHLDSRAVRCEECREWIPVDKMLTVG